MATNEIFKYNIVEDGFSSGLDIDVDLMGTQDYVRGWWEFQAECTRDSSGIILVRRE